MRTYKSKVEIIYEQLREDIVNGTFKPGDRIVISQIAKQNDVSVIPVREAVRILESEHLITVLPNVGPIVTQPKEEDIIEQFMIKGALEGYAARLSIDFLDEEKINELKSVINEMRGILETGNLKEYGKLNKKFHCIIYNASPYENLYKMIVELWDRWEQSRSVFILAPKRIRESIEEHEKILELIINKCYWKIEEYIREHKIRSAHGFVEYLTNEQIKEGKI